MTADAVQTRLSQQTVSSITLSLASPRPNVDYHGSMPDPDSDQSKHKKNDLPDPDKETVVDNDVLQRRKNDTTIQTRSLDDALLPPVIDPHAPTTLGRDEDQATRSTLLKSKNFTPVTARSTTQELELAKFPHLPGYRYLKLIGRGGMGIVVHAEDTRLNRDVALKLPLPQFLDDKEFRERFLREARSVASIRHKNICPIYDFGEHGEQLYLVMPFIQGDTLDDWLDKHPSDARKKAELLAAVADAVAAAHAENIIHRDLKPSNIIIDEKDQTPLLMDFGLAKQTSEENASLLTQDGQVVGTPAYMSPEQARGSRDVHAAADIYSLGAILYELLTDQPPYLGGMRKILLQLESGPPPAPKRINPKVNTDLETICLKAMARLAKDRYASASELAEDLRRFASGESIQARRLGLDKRLVNFFNRHRFAIVSISLLLIALLSSAVYLLSTADRLGQIAQIQDQIDSLDDKALLSSEQRTQIQNNIQLLAQADAKAAGRAQERLQQAIIKTFHHYINQSRINQSLQLKLESLIQDVKAYDYKTAVTLTNHLEERLRNWQTVGELNGEHPDWQTTDDSLKKINNKPVAGTQLMTSRPCEITVHWKNWNKQTPLACGLRSKQSKIYEVKLSKTTGVTKSESSWEIILFRDASPLSFWPISTPDDNVQVNFQIIANTIHINYDGKEYTYQDAFPLSYENAEVYLNQDNETLVQLLRLRERGLISQPSDLELGDRLFAQKQWQAAQQAYSNHQTQAENQIIVYETRYKKAICLRKQGKIEQANAEFASLLQDSNTKWSSLAGCQLWAAHLEAGQIEDAEAVATLLDLQFDRSTITTTLPFDLRRRIRDHYLTTATSKGFLIPNENRTAGLRNLIKVNELLTADPRIIGFSYYMYMRSLHWEQDYQTASEVIRHYINKYGTTETKWSVHMLSDDAWIKRLNGQATEAIAILDDYNRRCQKDRHFLVGLAPEYARCLLALGKTNEAIQYLEKITPEQLAQTWYHLWADIYNLKAHISNNIQLRSHYHSMTTHSQWKNIRNDHQSGLSGFGTYYSLMATQYEGDPDECAQVFDRFVRNHIGQHGDGNSLNGLLRNLNINPQILKGMWETPRGKRVSEDFILRRHDFPTCVKELTCLFVYTEATMRCFPKGMSQDEEQLLWHLTTESFDAFQNGELSMQCLVGLAISYKGISGQLGWGFTAPLLPENIRGPITYLMSQRYQQLGKQQEAQAMLDEAIKYMQPGSHLERLINQEK